MNVEFFYVQEGSVMPTEFVPGAIYFNANDHKLYRAKDATTVEAFGGSGEPIYSYDADTQTLSITTL